MKNQRRFLIAILCACTLFIACQQEEIPDEVETNMELGLYLNLESESEFTRAKLDEEAGVFKLYALYFKKTGAGIEDADYTYVGGEVLHNTTTALDLSALIRLRPETTAAGNGIGTAASPGILSTSATTPCKIMFIANTATAPSLTAGTTLAAAKTSTSLNFTMPGTASILPTNDESNYIPMYTCTNQIDLPSFSFDDTYYLVQSGTGIQGRREGVTKGSTYPLIRSMAKFTIKSQATKSSLAADEYYLKITSVKFKSGYTSGRVCHTGDYLTTVVTGTNHGTLTGADATLASLGETTWGAVTTGVQAITPFYTAERNNTNPSIKDRTSNCYLEIEGDRMKTTTGTKLDTKTYMLYIPQVGTPTSVGPILRNHHYIYTINSVMDNSINVTLSVQPWTEVPGGDPIQIN